MSEQTGASGRSGPPELHRARAMWALFEPVHAVSYFAPESRAVFEEAGLRGFWRAYFAGRMAPLGPVGPHLATALCFSFAPGHVARALPAVWSLASPEQALALRQEGARRALTRLLDDVPDEDVVAAAEAVERAVTRLQPDGRGIAAANLGLPPVTDPHARLWQACTTLREHRGDGHVAALVGYDVTGLEVLVLRAALDLRRDVLQPARGWSDDDWAAATATLTDRGVLAADGSATELGRTLMARVEAVTDNVADRAWRDDAVTEEVRRALRPLAVKCQAVWPDYDPIGFPRLVT